uniref:Autophagy-related protein 13 n=1 Tax=Steinernema glaseri TaxID=37863 RepID=A0A1I7ZD72_9BILA
MSALVSSQNANQQLLATSSSYLNKEITKFRAYFKAFTSRFVQAIVQARMGIKVSNQCQAKTEQSEWFNLLTDEVGEVSAELRRNLKENLPDAPAINLDILLRTADGGELQLEAWRLAVDTSDVQPDKGDGRCPAYHNLSTALKSVICAARCTPTYRRYVFSQGEDTYILCYRIYVGENISTLGEDAVSLTLATLPSPVGRFTVELRYRTKMEIERPPPTPPQGGRTRAASERLSSEPNLSHFNRNDQRRHSAREDLLNTGRMPSMHSQPVLVAMATSPPCDSPGAYATSPNYSECVGTFSTSPVSEYGDAQSELDPSVSRSRRSSRKSSDGEEGEKERKKVQIQKFPFSGLLDRSPAKPRMTQSLLGQSRLKNTKPSSSSVSMTIEEEKEDSGRDTPTPKAESRPPMTEEEVMALPPLLQSFLAPQYFDFSGGEDSIPESEDSYVRVPLFGAAEAEEQSGHEGLAATVDLFQYRAEKEFAAIFDDENRSHPDFQALIKGYAAEKDKFDDFVESVQVDEDSD